ncbi:MAG: SET domain-containing protein-lysine N-methyltransferase [Chitinophagia bacterium]|nr:SET domain-containing protein-lysine N-methyltransferase [Chitinophagia bacterium]
MKYPQLYVAQAGERGRGVYTRKKILADTIVETAHVIVMTRADRDLLDKTLLHDYIFEWQPDGADMCCMALGRVPLYNHSSNANCEYFMDYDSTTIYVQAVRDIEPGEELTINYNGAWNNADPVWFDAV